MNYRNSSIEMHGFLNLHKPPSLTSHDAVAIVRREVGRNVRVGHCGTLDPAATGVLVLCLGAATRLSSFITEGEKDYEVTATFGIATDSLDADGSIVEEQPCPELKAEDVRNALPQFTGEIWQTPPMTSAIHYQGRRLYHLAHQGKEVARPPRKVRIPRLRLLHFTPGSFPKAVLEIRCSSGTYVRSLCADLGKAIGCPAYASRMVRTGVGPFRLEHSLSLKRALELAETSHLQSHLTSPLKVPLGLPTLTLNPAQAADVQHGQHILVHHPQPFQSPTCVVKTEDASLLAICKARPQGRALSLRPTKVIFLPSKDILRKMRKAYGAD